METYKSQELEAFNLAIRYVEDVYELSGKLSQGKRENLCDQIERAATALVLNIAGGTTVQTNPAQRRFLSYAFRSYVETIDCLDLIEERGYLPSNDLWPLRKQGRQLFLKLAAFRNTLR